MIPCSPSHTARHMFGMLDIAGFFSLVRTVFNLKGFPPLGISCVGGKACTASFKGPGNSLSH